MYIMKVHSLSEQEASISTAETPCWSFRFFVIVYLKNNENI